MEEDGGLEVTFGEAVEWKVNRYDALIVAATFIQGMAEAVAATAALTRRLAGGHSNWLESRRQFAESVGTEIESLPTDNEE